LEEAFMIAELHLVESSLLEKHLIDPKSYRP
jgi:hypothetical protein